MKTVLIVGSTGLVGRAVMMLALADASIARVVVPTRRPLGLQHEKLVNPVVDFDALPARAEWWRVDAVICTLGTTIRKAGSQAAFRKVDHEYPMAVARLARAAGAAAFAFTSSTGANAKSRTFYLRTKGETERDLAGVGFDSLTVVRPSLIGGDRDERRWGESLGLKILSALEPLLPGRYRIVPAERIAAMLLESAMAEQPGVRIVESEAIRLSDP
jgi:uncharacterized protein YbjT (DUF2867 family)